MFVYFTGQQYFYRSSHRERFSSLQFGKVCPGRNLCNEDLEWALMILESYGAQILCILFLPMFTLNYKGGTLSRKNERTIELKIRKRLRKEANDKLNVPEEPGALYDADDDLLLSGDESGTEKGKAEALQSSHDLIKLKDERGALKSNLGVLKRAIYMMTAFVTLLFLCSSIFAYATSREIIFPERTAPKYIFDMIQMAIFLVFITIWV